mmetsp:Transcript_4436/g.17709  ORF Transcript_4436/g.17709 Transcript_4436/m.17709 type:complete len:261 (+) Transcript_4436:3956-4738(+)
MVNLFESKPMARLTANRSGASTAKRGFGSSLAKSASSEKKASARPSSPTTRRTAASAIAEALTSALLSFLKCDMKSRWEAPMVSRIRRSGMYVPAPSGTRMSASASDMSATPSGESTEYSLISGSKVRCLRMGEWNERIALWLNSDPSASARTGSRLEAAYARRASLASASRKAAREDAEATSEAYAPRSFVSVAESASGNRNEGSLDAPLARPPSSQLADAPRQLASGAGASADRVGSANRYEGGADASSWGGWTLTLA